METINNIAVSAIDALKGAPAVLGLLLINALFVGGILYAVMTNADRHERQLASLIEKCLPDHRVK